MENIQIALLNDSFIINRGLQFIFNKIKGIHLSPICTQWSELENILDKQTIDIILINNHTFITDSNVSKAYKTLPNIRWAILEVEDIEINSLFNFEFKISIYDNELYLINKLNTFVENKTHLHNISSSIFELSEREKEILRQVALGLTNSEIADKLFISQHTVITHRKNITSKLGIKTISGLTVYALLNDFINMDDVNELK